MDWTITTEIIGRGDRDASVKVIAVKGETTLERTFSGITSREGLKGAVKNWLANYENLKTMEAGTLDLSDPTPEPEPEKTQAELDKEAWDADWAKLQAIQPYIDAGVFTGQETVIVNLRNKVKTNFKPAYLGL